MIQKIAFGIFAFLVVSNSQATCKQMSLANAPSDTGIPASFAIFETSTVTATADACFSYNSVHPGTTTVLMQNEPNEPYRVIIKDGATIIFDHFVTDLVEVQKMTTSGAGNYTITIGSINPDGLPARVDFTVGRPGTDGQSFVVSISDSFKTVKPSCEKTNSCGDSGGRVPNH